MKKHMMKLIAVCMVGMVLLTGCGELTLEEKVTQVQQANTIKVQDVIDLMELEGLTVDKVATDREFQQNWPDAVLVQVNDTHYVALKNFEENLWDRRSAMSEIGWEGGLTGDDDAVQYIGQHYMGYEAASWVPSGEYAAKNIVALVLPIYPDNMSELSRDDQSAWLEKLNGVSKTLQRVFYHDINGIVQEAIAIENDNFTITGTLSYYATGVVDESAEREWTYYDAHSWLDCEIVCSDALWEQYQGAEYTVAVERPENWRNAHGSMSQSGVLDAPDKHIDLPNCYTDEVLWSAPEGKPVYALTFQIADFTETIYLEPEGELTEQSK